MRIAVFGATGPIGRRATAALLDRGVEVRVVSRSPERLERDFGPLAVERVAADLEDEADAVRAAAACDRVIHAVGLPGERFERHVPIARRAVAACREAGAKPFLVTSYWSYGPGDADPMPETRPRAPGSRMAEVRAREEAVFLEAGGAVARLPDFFGPEPGTSLLNDALDAARRGVTATWPGDPDRPRDFLFHPDAGPVLADLALRDESYGEPWNVPGSGPETPRRLVERAAEVAGTEAKVRRVRRWMARLVAIARKDVRPFVDVIPLYEAPAILDTAKIEALLGPVRTTPYAEAIPLTLEALASRP